MTTAEALLRQRLGDRSWRLSNLYRIVDRQGRERVFKPNPAQRRLLADAHAMNVILKARQLGFTTLIQLLMLDACLFTSNLRAGIIAHRLEDAEAIFRDRIKFAYDRLPLVLRQVLAAERNSAHALRFANNSEIRVGTSLRSGTFQMLHVSEYGRISVKLPETAREIRTGALNAVAPGRQVWIESTAQGREGEFYELVQRARELERRGIPLSDLDFRFHFFPWWQERSYRLDPADAPVEAEVARYFDDLRERHGIVLTREQMAWYARKAATQGEAMRHEFPSTPDEAFEVAIEGAYYGDAMARAEKAGRVAELPVEDVPTETWWDLGIDDATAIWFVQRVGSELRLVDYAEGAGEGLAYYAGLLRSLAEERGYDYGAHVAPHDIKVRELGTGRSRLEIAGGLGIDFQVCPRHEVADGIEAVRAALTRCWFDGVRCAQGLRALRAYRREWDDAHGTWRARPRHDWSSHAADAFRTGIVGGNAPPEWRPLRAPVIGSIA
ncbi:MAG: terminase [Alphaproteobacteria bacterium]